MRNPTQEQIDAAEAIAHVDGDVVRGIIARVPPSWNLVRPWAAGGVFRRGDIQVIFTVARYDDGRIWVHASATGVKRSGFFLPTWDDMKRVKHDFIGPDRWSYQVFPAESHYVNVNPYVLHLYALEDGSAALPDFTWGLGEI